MATERLFEAQASTNQLGNDLYWKVYGGEDGLIRWIGYNDRNWWDNVSHTAHFTNKIGKVTGRVYRLRASDDMCDVFPAEQVQP